MDKLEQQQAYDKLKAEELASCQLESSKQASEEKKKDIKELLKQIETTPEQLLKEKKETKDKQLTIPEQQTIASEKHLFEPPKPRPYTGIGQDKDPAVFEQWKQEVLDYYALTNIPPST